MEEVRKHQFVGVLLSSTASRPNNLVFSSLRYGSAEDAGYALVAFGRQKPMSAAREGGPCWRLAARWTLLGSSQPPMPPSMIQDSRLVRSATRK